MVMKMKLTKDLIDTRDFLVDLTRDNLINGDIDNALKCTRLLHIVDCMIEGNPLVKDEERKEVTEFMALFD